MAYQSSSSSSSGSTSYTAYKAKRSSTHSIQSLSTPFIRPGAADAQIKAPQPSRAALPSQWSTASPAASPAPAPSPPASSGRPTPPPLAAFPFQSVPPGASPFPPSTPTRETSPTIVNTAHSRAHTPRARMPYLPTFQPQGVRRDRTEEFVANRRKRSEGKKLEEGRLCRRMEKLVTLHFPPPVELPSPAVSRPLGISQLAELSGTLRGKTAKDLWRSVAGGKTDAERAEQSIVKWQEDSEATRCPICSAAFGLKTRRHHCRLCGRVVCYLPPTPPADFIAPVVVPTSPLAPTPPPPAPPKPVRRERCSTFFTYEYEGLVVPGEKKPVGVIVEIEQVEPDLTLGGVVADVHLPKEKDEREKVRICRECLNIVIRNQDETLPPRTPTWVKLYEVLVQLEKEIEDALPEFQELVLGIQKPSTASSHPPSATAALALRKRLLTNLASYDTISKRIRDLPLTEGGGPGGSQDRLQRAIAARGALFLGEKLSLLRSLGDLDDGAVGKAGKKKKGKGGAATTVVVGEPTVQSLASLMAKGGEVGEKVAEASGQLAVLLEQESLVKGYVEDANARRQFEDAASLKASLDDLREEIARIRAAT